VPENRLEPARQDPGAAVPIRVKSGAFRTCSKPCQVVTLFCFRSSTREYRC
jgi:hypothetical protein